MRPIHPSADVAGPPIGAKLRSTRMAQGLTLAQVAESSGLSKGFLSRLERDETSPSVATLVQLCQVLSLPVGALFEEPEIQKVTRTAAPRPTAGATSRSPTASGSTTRASGTPAQAPSTGAASESGTSRPR